jgi:hypothetical protein
MAENEKEGKATAAAVEKATNTIEGGIEGRLYK